MNLIKDFSFVRLENNMKAMSNDIVTAQQQPQPQQQNNHKWSWVETKYSLGIPPPPTPTHTHTHTNSKLHERAEIEQNSENKSY